MTTFIISIGAIIQRNHITIGLVLLNYALLVDAIGILVIGTMIWFSTLQERAHFHKWWLNTSPAIRITLQDKVNSSPDMFSAYLKDSNSFSVAGISVGQISQKSEDPFVDPRVSSPALRKTYQVTSALRQ